MPKAIPIISAFHNLSAGDLADEHGQLCAQIADLETRKRSIAHELIRRGVCGGDLSDYGRLPTTLEADERYKAAVEEWLVENPASPDAAAALVEFAGILAADRLVGEVMRNPVNDERDAYHQSVALASVAGWL